jgi:cysteinyl-tRNA synthetase
MALRLYNTLTRRLEDFAPIEEGRVRMYTCGPTVYDRAHIGNFRTFLFEDILRRFLEWKGYEVVQVRNLTDVDDRTIQAALAKRIGLRELTEPYVRAFFEDSDRLGMERAEHYPRATDYVPQMIELVRRLEERGLAYVADGSVYFDISKFPDYGRLAQLDRASLKEGERVSGDQEYEKEDARDFVLWKGGDRPDEGDVAVWDSPWGSGRPGWHLECSVMALHLLGQPIDIHSGGVDLIFPHHTNEIAQVEGATGKPFARYWLHAKHALLNGRKMSKSEGNYLTLDDLVERGYRPSAIRRLLVSGHYRGELNFTLAGLDDAARSVERLVDFRRRLASAGAAADAPTTRLPELARQAVSGFERALDDDLNVAEAWAALFQFVREANAELDRAGEQVAAPDARAALEALESMDRVFGVLALAEREEGAVPEEKRRWIEERLAERAAARAAGDYARADEIRAELAGAGVEVEDTPRGSRWRLVRRG